MAAIQNELPVFGLGDRLRKAREFRGIKAAPMAAALTDLGRKTSPSSVSAWENGESQPRKLQELVRLWASITDIPEAWFWGVPDLQSPQSAWLTADDSGELHELAEVA